MISRLKELGFYAHRVQQTSPIVGRVIYRKDGFGFGYELILPYKTVPASFLGSDIPLTSTLCKVIGNERELIVKIPGIIPDDVMITIIENGLNKEG